MKRPKEWLTDQEVESEIARLNQSEAVRLARKEIRMRYKRRQYLYQLRDLEKRGNALLASGYTVDNIEAVDLDEE